MKLLALLDRTLSSHIALEYATWLAGQVVSPLLVLGVVEHPSEAEVITQAMAEMHQTLKNDALAYETRITSGNARHLIVSQAQSGDYLVVIGYWESGLSLLERLAGKHPVTRLAEDLRRPIIYVPKIRPQLKRILLCINVVNGSDQWIAADRGEPMRAARIDAATNTLSAMGFDGFVAVRYGVSCHEVIEEMYLDDYDLIALNAESADSGSLSWMRPNVINKIAQAADRPLLVFAANPLKDSSSVPVQRIHLF